MLIAAGIAAAGSVAGGIAGNEAGRGARGEANNKMNDASRIINDLQNTPPQGRPLVLEQYRQAGLLTPEMEATINAGPSAMEKVTTNGKGVEAQEQALKQMQERATTGMTATDRAALAQAQSQANVEGNAKQQQIMQQFAQRGQGGSGAQLAAQLAEQQGGANRGSQNALDIMGKSQQQALQAAAQSGQMGSNLENQQFGEQSQKAQAADQMNRFNVQNQIGTQHSNIGASNQAQASNLANLQNVGNQNVGTANQEAARQRQGEQQDFNNSMSRSNALMGQSANYQKMGDQAAQSASNMFTGAGNAISGAFGAGFGSKPKADANQGFFDGGQIDFTRGGHVKGEEMVPGDNPANDTVDAKLSPGEIVIPKSLAQTSLGDKLLDLLKSHHEIKTHLDVIEKKANKPKKQKFVDGGAVQPQMQQQSPEDAMQFGQVYDRLKQAHPQLPDEQLFQAAHAVQAKIAQAKMAPPAPPAPEAPEMDLGEKIGQNMQRLANRGKMFNGGIVPAKGTPEYLEHLMDQLHGKKSYADGTIDELGGVVPQPEYPAPVIDPSLAQAPSQQAPMMLPETKTEMDPMAAMDQPQEEVESSRARPDSADDEIEKSMAKDSKESDDSKDEEPSEEDREPASDEVESEDEEDNQAEEPTPKQSKPESKKGFVGSSDALKQAQAERMQQSYLQQMQEGAALMGAGISKTDPSQALDAIRQHKDRQDMPVKSYEEQIKDQANDPNSEVSKTMRDYLSSKGFKVSDTSSASDMYKVAPYLQKDSALTAALTKKIQELAVKKEIADQSNQTKIEEGDKNRQSKEKIAAESAKQRELTTAAYKERTEKQSGGMNDRKMQTRFDKLRSDLKEGGKQPLQQQRQNLYRSQNLFLTNGVDPKISEKDIDKIPDAKLNKINKISVIENGLELNRLLTGSGVAAQNTLNKLIPNNINMSATQVQDFITNKLNPADQAQALKSYMKIAARVRDQAQKNVKDYSVQTLAGAGDILKYFPEQSKELLAEHELSDKDLKANKGAANGDSDKVTVEKDGKRFKLPKSQLEQAIGEGYSQVQ